MAEGIDSLPAEAAGRRTGLGWFLLGAVGIVVIAAAAWGGYRSGFGGEVQLSGSLPAADPAASSTAARSPSTTATVPPPFVATGPAPTSGGGDALRWPLWEFQLAQPIPPLNPPLTPPGWRLLGATMSRDGWKVAILRQGSPQPELLGLGASLPGGYVIKAISDEDVTFAIDNREVVLSYTGSR